MFLLFWKSAMRQNHYNTLDNQLNPSSHLVFAHDFLDTCWTCLTRGVYRSSSSGAFVLVSKGAMHLLEYENLKFNGPRRVLAPITPPPHFIIRFCLSLVYKISSFHSFYSGRVYTNLLVFLKDLYKLTFWLYKRILQT